MRTPARIVVPVAAAALPLTSCSSTANDTGGDQISLITDGTLTVCTNPPYEPFEFEQDGKVVGLDMDIVNEVAKDLGVELAIKVTLFEGIQSGEEFEVGTTFPTGEQYGVGVKTGNTALLAAFNDSLARIMSDGTYDDIYIKYIGTQPVSYTHLTLPTKRI